MIKMEVFDGSIWYDDHTIVSQSEFRMLLFHWVVISIKLLRNSSSAVTYLPSL